MSQTAEMLDWMQDHPTRWLSPDLARTLFHTSRLAARVLDAKQLGHEFETRTMRHGKFHWSEYRLRQPVQADLFAAGRDAMNRDLIRVLTAQIP